MIFDQQSLLSDRQAIAASSVSTYVLDTGAHGSVLGSTTPLPRDLGKGRDVPILIQVVESFVGLTSLSVSIETDDNVGFASAKTVWTSPTIPAASLVAGYKFPVTCLPLGTDERYIRLSYTVTGGPATAGNITAGLTMGVQTNG